MQAPLLEDHFHLIALHDPIAARGKQLLTKAVTQTGRLVGGNPAGLKVGKGNGKYGGWLRREIGVLGMKG